MRYIYSHTSWRYAPSRKCPPRIPFFKAWASQPDTNWLLKSQTKCHSPVRNITNERRESQSHDVQVMFISFFQWWVFCVTISRRSLGRGRGLPGKNFGTSQLSDSLGGETIVAKDQLLRKIKAPVFWTTTTSIKVAPAISSPLTLLLWNKQRLCHFFVIFRMFFFSGRCTLPWNEQQTHLRKNWWLEDDNQPGLTTKPTRISNLPNISF